MTRRLTSLDIRWCFGVFLLMRLALTAWSALVLHIYPIGVQWHAPNFAFYEQVVPGGYADGSGVWDFLLWPWYRWDTLSYLKIAVQGYGIRDGRGAFPPLYPLLIRVLGGLLQGHYLLAALLISSLAALMSSFLMYQEALRLVDRPTAQRAVLYFLSFPTAFFLVGGHTESLFVLLVLLTWRAASGEKWVQAGLWGSMAILTRFHGLALLVPLAYIWYRVKTPRKMEGLALLAIPIALLAWLLYVRFGPSGEFPWSAQSRVWREHVGWPWEGVVNNALALVGLRAYGDLPPFPVFLDLLAAVLLVGLVIGAFRRLPREHMLLMGPLLLLSLVRVNDQGLLRSMSRYVLPLFPGYILLARAGARSRFHWPWICSSFALQALASAVFFLWFWVA